MSDLKHKTPEELRKTIRGIENRKRDLRISWENKEAQAARLQKEADALRIQYHNLGQRECWARGYLAEKT